jgi:seryl-tRNA synthetase
MLDLKWIVENEAEARQRLGARGIAFDLDGVLSLNEKRKNLARIYDEGRHQQRQLSQIFSSKEAPQDAKDSARETLREVSDNLKAIELERTDVEEQIRLALLMLPNIPHESVPPGRDADDNVVVRTWGEKPHYTFTPKDHLDVGCPLGIFDFDAAAALSGARFAVYRGAGALLERALMMFMLDLHTREHGYTEVFTPYLVLPECMEGTGQLPKFAAEAFRVDTGHYLIPTAEVPVTNLHRNQILEGAQLPIRYVAYSSCFRSEAGSYGRDTRGLTRLHQFQKVELVHITETVHSYGALEALTLHAEEVLKRLGLHYRTVALCAGDLGQNSCKTYDLEVWLPGQNMYREISSCSNFGDFQARRASIRYRPEPGGKPEFAHTLNGSGLAIGRTLMAIVENFQQEDGSIAVPQALRPYMGGLERITRA